MLLLNVLLHHELTASDKGRLTRYELNAYPYEIIIGLQRYGFSYNCKRFLLFFKLHLADIQQKEIIFRRNKNIPGR